MSGDQDRFNGDARILHQKAVRTPLPDLEAERVFHENMMTVAEGRERKAELLADPDVPLLQAYEMEFERVAESFKRRLRRIAGENYEDVAMAYFRGKRDDRIGELSSYYFEALWRIQQRTTVTDMIFFPLILRYPDSFTMNVRFATGYTTPESVRYESPEHLVEEFADEHKQTYYEESSYSQQEAAAYLKETAQIIREEFPDPDTTPFDERKYGGIVSAGGRRGTTFSSLLERVEPDRERFDTPVTEPTLVDAGEEARRTERELLCGGEVVL
ncbi:hypothetical protein [Natronorubrum aibiense]|uniref:Uncharacterized protein n=1 Tax=Natronorubrum aibiense TaxID=348826 RepID=A0A5P9PA17_9EURY|nr:hypothetical protein [Natronorubrum aibiense]QFU84975.1 hypothetical protein GCU68_20870 [Natronorubrum aibiense]